MKKIFTFLVMAICLKTAVFTQINPYSGGSRAAGVQFVINDTVYIGLGYDDSGVLDDFWKYSKSTNQWSQITSFPGGERYNAVAFTIGEKAYVGLGQSTNNLYHKDFYCYDPSTGSWSAVADFGGLPRRDAVSFTIGNYAFVGTGSTMITENVDYANSKDFWKYDPVLNEWSQIADCGNDLRQCATAFSINGKGYVTGGSHYDSYSIQRSDVQEYDTTTNTWTERIIDGINLSFNNATAFALNGKGYICYGNKGAIVSYDPATNEVDNLGDLLNVTDDERFGAISFVLDEKAYFGLGYYGFFTTTYMNDIQEISLPVNPTDISLSSVWIDENRPNNTLVGLFSTADENVGATHTYEFTETESFPDNNLFSIQDNSLLAPTLNYEADSLYFIKIISTNSLDLSTVKEFMIHVADIKEVITGVNLEARDIYENSEYGQVTGTFSTVDEETDANHTYELIDNESYPDNEKFYISFSSLEAKPNITCGDTCALIIKVRSTNQYDVSFEKEFAINMIKDNSGNSSGGNNDTINDGDNNGTTHSVERTNQDNITVYPNPVVSKLNIQTSDQSRSIKEVLLYSIDGKAFRFDDINNIDISDFSPGIYYLTVEIGEEIYKQKIIKQ